MIKLVIINIYIYINIYQTNNQIMFAIYLIDLLIIII